MTLAAPQTASFLDAALDRNRLSDLVVQALKKLDAAAVIDAIALIDDIQSLAPGDPIALYLLGLVSFRLEEPGKAMAAFEAAQKAAPDIREYAEALSIICAKLSRIADSLFFAKLASAATREAPFPGLLPAWFGNFEESFFRMADEPIMKQANAAAVAQNWQSAMMLYRKATEVMPGSLLAWRGLVDALCELDQPYEAISTLTDVTRLAPEDPADFMRYARAFALAGYWPDALSAVQGASNNFPGDPAIGWERVRLLFAYPESDKTSITKAAADWGRRFVPDIDHGAKSSLLAPGVPLEQRRLKLGVFSSHWMEGDGLDLIAPLLEALPRRLVELFVYADDSAKTALGIRVRGIAAHWQNVADLDDDTIAFMLANDTLDAFIDLDGPLRRKRHSLFARHPVAFTLTISDLPETAKSCGFDAVIGDEFYYLADEPSVVLRVPGILTLPLDHAPLSIHTTDTKQIVFGSLAQRRDMTNETAALWSQILMSLPTSKLHLMPERMGGRLGVEDVIGLFDPGLSNQIVMLPAGQTVADYVSSLDVLLDPFESSNAEETVAAAASGIPVVTLPGILPARQLLGGWLNRLGIHELVAKDKKSYVDAAIAVADRETNSGLRERLCEAALTERKEAGVTRGIALDAGLRRMIMMMERHP